MSVENLSFLNIVNEVFTAIRENKISTLSGTRNTRTNQIVQAVKDTYSEVISKSNGHWKFLEADGSITLITSTREYAEPDDLKDLNTDSFVLDNYAPIWYEDYNTFISHYPDATEEGQPINVSQWGGNFIIGSVPSASYNGKKISYNYWKKVNDLISDGDYPLIPEEFRRRVLVAGAAAQVLQGGGSRLYDFQWQRYVEGLNDLKRAYSSIKPQKARVTHIF